MNKPLLTSEQCRLIIEIGLLQRVELAHGLPVGPIIEQLAADANRPLPDVLPAMPKLVRFWWPARGIVDYGASRRLWSPWTEEHL